MGKRNRPSGKLGRPRFYTEKRAGNAKYRTRSAHPMLLDDLKSVVTESRRGWVIGSEGGWVGFIPPGESAEVQLHIPPGGDPYEAMREWFFRREATRRRTSKFDVRRLLPVWNYGSPMPRAEIDKEGFLRLGVLWSPPWDYR